MGHTFSSQKETVNASALAQTVVATSTSGNTTWINNTPASASTPFCTPQVKVQVARNLFGGEQTTISRGTKNAPVMPKITINSFLKNNCRCDSNCYWLYNSMHDTDGWWFMSSDACDAIERLYQNYLQDSDSDYMYNGFKYDFNQMVQSGDYNTRKITRLTHEEYIALRNEYISAIVSRSSLWVCKMNDKHMIYNPNIQNELDAARRQGTPAIYCKLGNGYEYTFDLTNMTQQNGRTARLRPIELLNPRESPLPMIGSFEFTYT